MTEKKDPVLKVAYNGNVHSDPLEKKIYTGEMLIQTVCKESGFEKHVYIKNSFAKEGLIHIDTDGAELAIKYDAEKIKKCMDSGVLSSDDGQRLQEDLLNFERKVKEYQEWIIKNPNSSNEEKSKAFHEINGLSNFDEEKAKRDNDLNLSIRRLIAQKDYIEPEIIEKLPGLFKSITNEDSFGISKPIMDRIYHLPELLKNAVVENIDGEMWEVKSELNNYGTGKIGLHHTFRAKDYNDANKYLDEYRNWMGGEGLKVLTAYWKKACELRFFNFSTPLTDVMSVTSEEERSSPFSVKERKKFWSATRKLEETKLIIEILFSKKTKKKDQRIKIEHRLLDVGARTHDIGEDTYPNHVLVKVLDPTLFQQQAYLGTRLHNNTPKLHPKDILFALSVQIRKAQTREKETNSFDEEFLIERSNLKQTAKTNKRKARQDLHRKIKNLEKKNIIDSFSVTGEKEKKYTFKMPPQEKTK